jgi:interferon, gamma-inducible protein 30
MKKARSYANPQTSASAAQLLEQVRESLLKQGPEIKSVPFNERAAGEAASMKARKSGLYRSGSDYDSESDDGSDFESWDGANAPAVAEVTDGEYPGAYGVSYGPIDDWRGSVGPAVAAIGAAVGTPLQWFLKGPQQDLKAGIPLVVRPAVNHPRPQAENDGRDETDLNDELDWPSTDKSPSTPVLERVNKLIDLRRQADNIQSEQSRVLSDVYDDAINGNMARVGTKPEAAAFSEGFMEGAVEASKKSMEQQKEFAEMLKHQEEIVERLEEAVRSLEEHQRQENWAKTASQYPEEPAPAPVRAAAAPPAEVEAAPAPAPAPAPASPPPPKKKFVTGQPEQQSVPIFNIDFYMEAMCPGCMHFTTAVLAPVLSVFDEYVQLRAIPFGNAAIVNGTVFCQHGADECTGNKIELCMMKQYPDWRTWFPPFKCIESSTEPPLVSARTCLKDHGMDAERLIACATSPDADVMQLQAGNETVTLDPPHQFTPWVVVNGEPVGDKVMDLQTWLCNKLPEDHKAAIAACAPSKFKDVSHAQTLHGTKKATKGFCYPSLKWDGTK